jgi:hypothetical protein
MERRRVELLPVVSCGKLVGVVKREAPRAEAVAPPVPVRAPKTVVAPAPTPTVQAAG